MSDNLSELGVLPKLDYLIQYPVTNVHDNEDGSYTIEFQGGALLTDTRGEGDPPVISEGAALLTLVLGKDETRLLFAESYIDPMTQQPSTRNETWVALVPGDYTLTDPRFPDAPVDHKPQVSDETQEQAQASIREQFNQMAAGNAQDGPEPVEEG